MSTTAPLSPTPRNPPAHPPRRTPHPVAPAATRLGWDDGWAGALHARLAQDDLPAAIAVGRIARVDKGACDLMLADGSDDLVTARWSPAVARDSAQDPGLTPATGDWAVLAPAALDSADWVLHAVLPRRTELRRLTVSGTSHVQVLAANADVVAIVEGVVPDLDLGRVERLLALAWSSGARPALVLTKADLHPDPAAVLGRVARSAAGCDVHLVSAPTDHGLAPLRAVLDAGSTLALVGASGVGKSTLVNALLGRAAMATRTLGVEGKGRHTTVTRELHLAPGGGAVLDTPGLRSVGLDGSHDLAEAFADVADLAATCRFADCGHTTEPGCAVAAAVADGSLPRRRLESFRDLEREAAFAARRTDHRLRAAHARELKLRQRAYRARPDKR